MGTIKDVISESKWLQIPVKAFLDFGKPIEDTFNRLSSRSVADAYADNVIPNSREELAVKERHMLRKGGPEAAKALHTAYEAWEKGDKAAARAAVGTMLIEGTKFANLHPIDSIGGSIQNGLEALGYAKADPARCK